MGDPDPVARILRECHERRVAGEQVDFAELVRAHPEHADELTEGLRALDALGLAFDEIAESIPESIGEYDIVRELGRGGMGVVYEAEQTADADGKVALKVLSPSDHRPRQRAVKRFQRRSARRPGRLHHTNIVPVHGLGQHAGYWYYAMELVAGTSALSHVRSRSCARAARGPTPQASRSHDVVADTSPSLTRGTGRARVGTTCRIAASMLRRRGGGAEFGARRPASSTATSSRRTCCSIGMAR